MTAKLQDAGFDYVRVLSSDGGAQEVLRRVYGEVRQHDEHLGYLEGKGGAFGFYGHKTRHALYGVKKEWQMLQISGYAAKRALRLTQDGTQASRIDLQLTYQVGEENVEGWVRKTYNDACGHQDASRKHLQVNMIESRHKAQTVYIGSRASDIFFRCYDKFAESGKEEHKGCVRFELELKGRASKALWRALCDGEQTLRSSLQMVIHMLKERGVTVPCEDIDDQDVKLPPREATKEESTIAWLHRQVGPVVKRLTQTSHWMYAFNALFDGAMSEWERKRIVRSLAIYWGS